MISIAEVCRYLGLGKTQPDQQMLTLIHQCVDEVAETASPKHIYRRFRISHWDDAKIETEGIVFPSHVLAKNLRSCDELILFAATLGIEVDILLNRYMRLQISKAVVIQAVAAALIEDYINQAQKQIASELMEEKRYLRPRFSPGYGDLPLSVQGKLLQILDAQKRIGLTLSTGDVMIPEKSVTAIIGISQNDEKCPIDGCEICTKTNCIYRRSGGTK